MSDTSYNYEEMRLEQNAFELETTNTAGEVLSAIKVGVIDQGGNIVAIVTLDEIARTGHSQQLYFRNFANFGEAEFELVTSGRDNLMEKVEHWRGQQRTQSHE